MNKFLSSSRYTVSVGTDKEVAVVSNRKAIYGTRYYLYTSKEGDTFDLLALRVLGSPDHWWRVADLNPHVPFPDQIPVGTSIRVPRP